MQYICLMVIERDGGLSTLCHSCRVAYQQRLLKTFSDHYSLPTKEGYSLTEVNEQTDQTQVTCHVSRGHQRC